MPKLVFCLLLVLVCGCSTKVSEANVQSAYQSVEKADEAMGAKDFAKAAEAYSCLVESGLLHPDAIGEVFCKLALCKIETNDVAGAESELAKAEQGGATGALFPSRKGKIALKAGDKTTARKEFAEAKKD